MLVKAPFLRNGIAPVLGADVALSIVVADSPAVVGYCLFSSLTLLL